ncbi:MAG: RecQ family ATP-dependent DNA helicase [Bacteroidota bacterium]|nr:RecQ family ATP-dependent DNA helicase [Bacteroidota bacterium]
MDPLDILKNKFGYTEFRLHQEAIIQSVLAKRDTFVLMPTGAGKSICYQIPALMNDGLTIVISPLIALMKDQVDALRLNGTPAAYINSTQTWQEQENILRDARLKKLKLLYLAPEKLLGNSMAFLHTLESFGISLIAIDEAHCISHWGHDFRPEYRMLATLKKSFPDVPVIALTATADKLTRQDILEKLELNDPAVFVSSFNRPNIRYTVKRKSSDVFMRLLDFLEKKKDESGIIYCLSRKSTETLAADLEMHGYKAVAYHAGMDRAQRSKNQEMFLRDEVRIVVATIAFGMGIDKSNVRYVVHMDLPKNIESYYQETGRAGRDGLESEALLFYSPGDVIKMKRFALVENNEEQSTIMLRKLDEMGRYGALRSCRRKYLLNYFEETAGDDCGNCDICLRKQPATEASEFAHNFIDELLARNERPATAGIKSNDKAAYQSRLFNELRAVRRELAIAENVPAYIILSDATLTELATYLPHTLDELSHISGFGQVKLHKYGPQFLRVVTGYCTRHHLQSLITEKIFTLKPNGKREHETSTRQQSLALFQQGKSVEQIAEIRKLSAVTIEGHLAFYVGQGKLPLDEVVNVDRVPAIREAIEQVGGSALWPIRNYLGDDYSFGEIKYVLADLEHNKVEEPTSLEWCMIV